MMKRKVATVSVALLLLPLAFSLIQPVKATSITWTGHWHNYITYDAPVNISTTRVVSGADGHCTNTVELVASIDRYTWDTFANLDFVYFRVVVYVRSVADPGYQPQFATKVSIHLDKIYDDQEHTIIRLVHEEPQHSQGDYLTQATYVESDPLDRIEMARIPVEYAVGLACLPAGFAITLINEALAFKSLTEGVDFQDAEYGDAFADSWWHNDFYLSESPVDQYCFNCFRWKQDRNVEPYSSYGLKIWATVQNYNQADIPTITTSPIYLVIYADNGGGSCPYVSTWNGTQYVLDNNILPASETSDGDVEDYYRLEQLLVPTYEGKLFSSYSLQIREFEHEHSYLDQVKLLAADHPPDVNVAVTPYGEILTYSNPVPPISAVDENGADVQSLLSSVDENYYQGYNGSYITLTFAPTDLSNGAKLVIREDRPDYVLKSPVYIQVLNATGDWDTVAVFHTRTYWATDIINMAGYLPDAEGDLKVRFCFVSNDKIDYVGLDTTSQASVEVHQARLISAFHSTQGNVKPLLIKNDQTYAELIPGEQIQLTFLLKNNQNEERTFILYTEGHYEAIG